jgi:Arc/MetJ-type ribon-helix-helix transcriptional regulator
MATRTLGFAVADEDRAALDELVEYFGYGDRSAYLRATLRVMRSVKLAEELRELQAYGQQKLAEHGHALDDIPAITRRVLKGRQ